jgi:glycosyltransferase involved in cell wall biosynthesis
MMPAYNAEPYVAQAIESVLHQRFANWELVVVNDGSTDRTYEIASGYGDPRVKVLSQRNKGEAAARNAALDHVQGEFVAFLDADDAYLPNHLEATVARLEQNPGLAGVYTDGYYISEGGHRLKRLSERRRPPVTGLVFSEVMHGPDQFGPPVCVVLRREPIIRRGLRFDEDIVIGPDWDFFLRYAAMGAFGYLGVATCLYRVHRTNITRRVSRERWRAEMAKCRIKAIAMEGFRSCPLEVRAWVLYDLLVNLLRDRPDAQEAVIASAAFETLPRREQARLLRLTASKLILRGGESALVVQRLERACRTDPTDARGRLVRMAYDLSPRACRALLRLRTWNQVDPADVAPFADLDL